MEPRTDLNNDFLLRIALLPRHGCQASSYPWYAQNGFYQGLGRVKKLTRTPHQEWTRRGRSGRGREEA